MSEQLDRIEDLVQSNPITKVSKSKIDDKQIFKIQELTPSLLRKPTNQNQEFLEIICQKLESLEACQTIVPETPLSSQASKNLQNNKASVTVINSDTQTNKVLDSIQHIDWRIPQKLYYPRATFADVVQEESNQNIQNSYSANVVYEWNIYGVSNYNILKILQQMAMVANVYKAKKNISNQQIVEIIITGFTGQLQGWWDFHLTPVEQQIILQAVKIHTGGPQ